MDEPIPLIDDLQYSYEGYIGYIKGVLWQINESVDSALNGCEKASEHLEITFLQVKTKKILTMSTYIHYDRSHVCVKLISVSY